MDGPSFFTRASRAKPLRRSSPNHSICLADFQQPPSSAVTIHWRRYADHVLSLIAEERPEGPALPPMRSEARPSRYNHLLRPSQAQPANSVTAPASGSFSYQTGDAAGTKFASRDLTGPTTTLALVSRAGTRYQFLPGLTEGLQNFAFRVRHLLSLISVIRNFRSGTSRRFWWAFGMIRRQEEEWQFLLSWKVLHLAAMT
jgi:hypothetical protein